MLNFQAMATPVLSKKQQKKTLSSKKAPKETVKNLLASPYAHYWPLPTPEDALIVENALLTHLQRVCIDRISIPWKQLKNVPRSDRRAFKQQFLEENCKQTIDNQFRSQVVFGVNSVTKLLENDQASCVLVSSEVSPQFMVKHVVDLCVLKSCRLLIVPKLRDLLKTNCGITSAAVSFKTDFENDPHALEIVQKVQEVSSRYPVPENHIYFEKRSGAKFLGFEDDEDTNSDSSDSAEQNETSEFILYRTSNDYRVFVPESSRRDANAAGYDFIPITTEERSLKTSEKRHSGNGMNYYQPLKIKRVKGNKERALQRNK